MRSEVIHFVVLFIVAFVLVTAHPRDRSSRRNYRRNDDYVSQFPLGGLYGFDGGLYGFDGRFDRNVYGRGGQCRQLYRNDCPLFDVGSNLVTRHDFIDKVVSQENGWFPYLSIEIDSPSRYGKCEAKWGNLQDDDTFIRPEVCFNLDNGQCEYFTEILRYEDDSCGRVKLVAVNSTSTENIYSQDLDQYFWRDLCVNRVSDTECSGGRFIDLNVKRDRFLSTSDRVPDMTGLPWDKIAADLKFVFGRDLSDYEVVHAFLGTECNLI